VKCIIAAESTEEEVGRAARLIAGINPQLPLVLQPVTPTRPNINAPAPGHMLNLQAVAKQHLTQVRVIPQTHRLGGYI
jgi:organic radical activating enzyme